MTHGLCGSPDCSHRAAAGFGLCTGCGRAARRDLRALPGLYLDCADHLVSTARGIVRQVGRSRPAGISLNDAAVSARADIVEVLSSWCALVTNEGGVAAPGTRAPADLVGFLDRHFGWLATHAAAGDFAAEVRELAAAARKVADPDTIGSRQLGLCGRTGCGRTVYLTTGGEGREHQVRCTGGHVWQPHEWMSLSRRSPQPERVA